MKVTRTKIPGVFLIEPDVFSDDRGALVRSFHSGEFEAHGLISYLKQSLCSINHKGVIRGMHFQKPPKEQVKVLYVARGSITDVILDLRRGSPTYGEYVSLEISDSNHAMVYIPQGCAHGFISNEDNTNVIYLQDIEQSKEHEDTIHIDSFGMEWGDGTHIVSAKDKAAQPLKDFDSPFVYKEQKYENIS